MQYSIAKQTCPGQGSRLTAPTLDQTRQHQRGE